VKYTVCVDFDGVIHAYTSPWVAPHVIPDPPVAGALQWILDRMHDDFTVVIHTTRARTWRGRRAIRAWLRKHGGEGMYYEVMGFAGLEDVKITHRKVPALVYIDDRAWRFDGTNWPSKEEIHRARPWNKVTAGG
jgi:hypothetical protein